MNIGENVNEPTKFAADIELSEKMKKVLEKNRRNKKYFRRENINWRYICIDSRRKK